MLIAPDPSAHVPPAAEDVTPPAPLPPNVTYFQHIALEATLVDMVNAIPEKEFKTVMVRSRTLGTNT